MVSLILLPLLFILIGALNASEDKIMFHWHKSIFKKLDEFWKVKFNTKFYFRHFFSEDSWRNKYNQRHYENGIRRIFTFKLHPAFTDWFHFSKSFRIIIELISFILICTVNIPCSNYITVLIAFIIGLFIIRNITFSLFFNKILHERISKSK